MHNLADLRILTSESNKGLLMPVIVNWVSLLISSSAWYALGWLKSHHKQFKSRMFKRLIFNRKKNFFFLHNCGFG